MSDEEPDQLYSWMEFSPENRKWGQITAFIPQIATQGPLTSRLREVAEGPFRELAQQHAQTTGHRVALRRYSFAETIESFVERKA